MANYWHRSLWFKILVAIMLLMMPWIITVLYATYAGRVSSYVTTMQINSVRLASSTDALADLMFVSRFGSVKNNPLQELVLSRYHNQLAKQLSQINRSIDLLQSQYQLLSHDPVLRWVSGIEIYRLHLMLSDTTRLWSQLRTALVNGELISDPFDMQVDTAYISARASPLVDAAMRLHAVLREDAAAQKQLQSRIRSISIVTAIIFAVTAITWLYWAVISRLRQAILDTRLVASGQFGHHLPDGPNDELGELFTAVNAVSDRTVTVLELLDSLQQGLDFDSVVQRLWESVRKQIPLDILMILDVDHTNNTAYLSHSAPAAKMESMRDHIFYLEGTPLLELLRRGEPQSWDISALAANYYPTDGVAYFLHTAGINTLLVTPLLGTSEVSRILVFGAIQKNAYTQVYVQYLCNISRIIAHSLDKTAYGERLLLTVIGGMAKLAENRDHETGGHLIRISLYSKAIAEALKENPEYRKFITPSFVLEVTRFAPMHDIGKVGISDAILLKPGKLTLEERLDMQRHTLLGGEVLRHCAALIGNPGEKLLKTAIEIAEGHHEKFDGAGYPHGLKGQDIPLAARITAAADVFDALTSKRHYKQAWPIAAALDYMRSHGGSHFDPAILHAMDIALPTLTSIYEQHKHT